MKLSRLETHDRLLHFVKDQSINIFQGVEDCLKKNTLSLAIQERSPYVYLFAHARTAEDGVNKRLFWQPRLSIPQAQTNSYLFRAQSKSDIVEIVWMIPPREMWKQYKKGNVTESNYVLWSIEMFQHNRKDLENPHADDMSEEHASVIMKRIVDEKRQELRQQKLMGNLYGL